MIRRISLLPVQVVLLACVYFFSGICIASAQSGDSRDPASGQVILIEPKEPKGALKVKQAKRVSPVNAYEGMQVRRGYLLILKPTAKAKILCGDGKAQELGPGPQPCPCTKTCAPEHCGIRYDGSMIGLTRGPDTDKGLFPVMISPRKTMLRNLRPTIRWSEIAGAKQSTIYKVILYGDGMKSIWTKSVTSETKLTYPNEEPSLMPGKTYKVVVATDESSSQQDRSPGLGFTTLTTDQAQMLADSEIKKKRMELPEPQTRLLISNLYAAKALYSEAIEQLEDLYATVKEPAIARMLGDLYAVIGLNRVAEKKYLEALRLTPANDYDELGLIQKNLALAYENLGILDQAIARLEEAINAYRKLGNKGMVNALLKNEQRLKRSEKRS